MKYLPLDNSPLEISNIIMGCMRIGNLPQPQLFSLIETALQQGITLFDHADIYGGNHHCEKAFGQYLAQNPSIRDKMLIQSKCAITPCGYDFSVQHIIKQTENSLSALNTDYLDILLLHRPDTFMDSQEVCEAFQKLKKQGKVKHFGVSNFSPMQIELLQKDLGEKLIINQLQLSLAHSLIFDEGMAFNMATSQATSFTGGTLEYSRLKGIMLQAWSPFQYGFFGGSFLGNTEKYPELNAELGALAKKYGVSPATIACAWITCHPANISVVTGTANPEHLTEACMASELKLERKEWYSLYKSAGNLIP